MILLQFLKGSSYTNLFTTKKKENGRKENKLGWNCTLRISTKGWGIMQKEAFIQFATTSRPNLRLDKVFNFILQSHL